MLEMHAHVGEVQTMIDQSHLSNLNESQSHDEMSLNPETLFRLPWKLAACRPYQQPTENISIMRWSAR